MSERQSTSPGRGPMGGGMRGAQGAGEKPQNFKKSLKDFLTFCKPYLPAILVALVAAAGGTILQIIGPGKLREMTDIMQAQFKTGIDLSAIGAIGLSLAIYYGLSALLNFGQGYLMATITQRISKRLRTSISDKINRLPLKYFDKTSYGDIISRVTNDIDTVGQSLNQSVSSLITAITMLAGSLIMMFITNGILAAIAIASSLVGFLCMIFILKGSQKHFIAQQRELGNLNGHVEEKYTAHNVIKVYNASKAAAQMFEDYNEKLYDSGWKSQFFSGLMMPIITLMGNLGFVAVCVAGAVMAAQGTILLGVIVAFMLYIRLFTQPLTQIAQSATALQRMTAASERVFTFLEEDELADESDKTLLLEKAEGVVEFDHVRFGYDRDKTIIHDFSARVRAGQKVAIVGPTGAGKTTLVNLLMRFYELDGGEIRLDRIPTHGLTRENVHEQFCMVLQDSWLFEGTIRENIIYSKQGVTDEDVIKACKAVGLHHFVRTLPEGYDTVLNEKASLSAGQKQLLTIARAMVQNAPLLILDEATSSVDTRTELIIQMAMDKLMVGRTSFVIAHRLSTIKNADLILYLENGDIVESGTHETLLAVRGRYAAMYQSQFAQMR